MLPVMVETYSTEIKLEEETTIHNLKFVNRKNKLHHVVSQTNEDGTIPGKIQLFRMVVPDRKT